MSASEAVTLAQLAAQIAKLETDKVRREAGLAGIPSFAEWQYACQAKALEKRLAREARGRKEHEARVRARAATADERRRLEARLEKIGEERASRLAQHARAEAKIREGFAEATKELDEQIKALDGQIDAEARLAGQEPVSVEVSGRALRGRDDSMLTGAIPDNAFPRQLGRMADKGKAMTGGGR